MPRSDVEVCVVEAGPAGVALAATKPTLTIVASVLRPADAVVREVTVRSGRP